MRGAVYGGGLVALIGLTLLACQAWVTARERAAARRRTPAEPWPGVTAVEYRHRPGDCCPHDGPVHWSGNGPNVVPRGDAP